MSWRDSTNGRTSSAAANSMARVHRDIETMTRRLELEKRRLRDVNKHLEVAYKFRRVKVHQLPAPPCKRPSSPQPKQVERRETTTKSGERGLACKSICAPLSPSHGAALLMLAATGPGDNASVMDTNHKRMTPLPCGRDDDSTGIHPHSPARLDTPTKVLLDRLELQAKKLAKVNHSNHLLREQVDQIRRRRLQLNGVLETIRLEIKMRSTQLTSCLEEASTSNTMHDASRARVAVMKKVKEAERSHVRSELVRMGEIMRLQGWDKRQMDARVAREDDGLQSKKGLIIADEELDFSASTMVRRIMKTAFLNCIQRRHMKKHQKNIEVFEQAFATIKQTTGIDSIEEIVKIFAAVENRNYSLLTYVNVMNLESEELEGAQRERRQSHAARLQLETQNEQCFRQIVGESRRQLQAVRLAIDEMTETSLQHQDLLDGLCSLISEVVLRIQQDISLVQSDESWQEEATKSLRQPGRPQVDTLPEWLDWMEQALGRFRDALPKISGDVDMPFSCAVANGVKLLAPKRLGALSSPPPLVKHQELPIAAVPAHEDTGGVMQKRGGGPPQKLEMLDEDSDEEDFGDKPLMLQDLRSRAEMSAMRRKRRATKRNKRNALGGAKVDTAASLVMKHRPSSRLSGPTSSATSSRTESAERLGTSSLRLRSPNREDVEDEDDEDDQEEDTEERSGLGRPAVWSDEADRRAIASLQATCMAGVTPTPAETGGEGGGSSACARTSLEDRSPMHKQTEPSVEELSAAFLQRYRMSREELEVVANRLNVSLHRLCHTKRLFDACDEGQSGFIEASDLGKLLRGLGEVVSEADSERFARDLSSDGSGEIEFFEFMEWCTSRR